MSNEESIGTRNTASAKPIPPITTYLDLKSEVFLRLRRSTPIKVAIAEDEKTSNAATEGLPKPSVKAMEGRVVNVITVINGIPRPEPLITLVKRLYTRVRKSVKRTKFCIDVVRVTIASYIAAALKNSGINAPARLIKISLTISTLKLMVW